jgi:hypothetical protein
VEGAVTSEGRVERVIRVVMVTVARISAALLVVGLVWWLFRPDAPAALFLLDGGVVLLMTVPLLRVVQSAARAVVLRDWLHVGTVMVVAALLAVTVWYAARHA